MNLGVLRVVSISDIVCDMSTRARHAYGVIGDLARNIEEHGLMHPIVVYSPNGEAPFTLIAGARRFVACQILKWTEISCRIYDTPMNEQELKAVELYENTMRLNLTSMEEAKLRTQLHETMAEIAGVKVTSSPGHSIADTAQLIGIPRRTLSEDIKLGRAIRDNPELKLDEEKNKSAALRKLKQSESVPRAVDPEILARARAKLDAAYGNTEPLTDTQRSAARNILQQLLIRIEDAPREELRELIRLLSASIGASTDLK